MPNKILDFNIRASLTDEFFDSLCRFFWAFGIDTNEAVNLIVKKYLEQGEFQTNSVGDLSIKSGFARSKIERIFSGNLHLKHSSERSVFFAIVTEVKTACKDNPILPIRGKGRSFYSLYNKVGDPTKSLSGKIVLDNMIDLGFVELINEKEIYFHKTIPSKFNLSKNEFVNLFSKRIDQYCHCLMHNYDHNKQTDKLFDRGYYSFDVSEENIDKATKLVSDILKNAYAEAARVIEQLETKDEVSIKKARKANKEVGFAAFVYKK